jgi:hypothetical protein
MTSPEPIEQACEVFEQKLDTFEKLMKACSIGSGEVISTPAFFRISIG